MTNAIVTGGASGIGEATSKAFLAQGLKVLVLDQQKPNFDVAFEEVDVRDGTRLEKIFRDQGVVDVVVHCAGIYKPGELVDTEDEDIHDVLDINLYGTALVNKYALRSMKSGCVLINLSSGLGVVPEPESAAYCASKAGIIMLTKALAQRYAAQGIRINAVLPGPIDTPMLRDAYASEEDFADYAKKNPLRRVGTPDEVAKLILYIASRDATFITGACIPIDGGESSSSMYTPK